VSTIYYPELSQEMAMRIGGEYSLERVTPKNFEKLAEEADMAKPLVWRWTPELADTIPSALPELDIQNPVAKDVAALIQKRSEKAFTGSHY
jgi:serine/threonine-protein kinase HipA